MAQEVPQLSYRRAMAFYEANRPGWSFMGYTVI